MTPDDDPAGRTTEAGDVPRPGIYAGAAPSPEGAPCGWSPAPIPVTERVTTEVAPQHKEGRTWQIGTDADVEWVSRGTTIGRTVTSAIPAVFDAYGTVVVPELVAGLGEHEQAVVRLLVDHSTDHDWWLGYLDTGASDVVFPEAPRVRMYFDWPYVLVKAGPEQALRWRSEPSPLHCGLPDLMFPTDRSWLISALWDDDWWCLGGSIELLDAVVREPGLEARRVRPGDDASPPGHAVR